MIDDVLATNPELIEFPARSREYRAKIDALPTRFSSSDLTSIVARLQLTPLVTAALTIAEPLADKQGAVNQAARSKATNLVNAYQAAHPTWAAIDSGSLMDTIATIFRPQSETPLSLQAMLHAGGACTEYDAYQQVAEFEKLAGEKSLSVPDLEKFTELMSEPNSASLRLFLAIGKEKSATAQWMANYVYDHRPPHNCYKNDSFCIAHSFDLEPGKKKQAGLWVIENAMAGYYESVTHGGFRLSSLLEKMGAMDYPISQEGYAALSHYRIKKMASALEVTTEDLAASAENVVNWCLGKGYKVERLQSTVSADSYISVNQAEELVRFYVPEFRQGSFHSRFEEARKNARDTNKVRPYKVEPKPRI